MTRRSLRSDTDEHGSQERQQPDDRVPSEERQKELAQIYLANKEAGRAPYAGVALTSRGELQWILDQRGWESRYNTAAVVERNPSGASIEPADLREVILAGVCLDGIPLSAANLSGADLSEASLESAQLIDVNLSGAYLRYACLAGASLRYATLHHAHLRGADLRHSDLTYANLTGARLPSAKLQCANLRGVRMDETTVLSRIEIDTQTRLLDVTWGGVLLGEVDWTAAPRLGDEIAMPVAKSLEEIPLAMTQDWEDICAGLPRDAVLAEGKTLVAAGRKQQIIVARTAVRAYHALSDEVRAQGLLVFASNYRLREQQLERHAKLLEFRLFAWCGWLLLDLVAGYGERPARAVRAYLIVVGTFAALYYALTNQLLGFSGREVTHLQWYEAVVLSISSFHGRGLFPPMLSLGDPVAIVAAMEAVVGLFVEIVFIATFTQRFFAR